MPTNSQIVAALQATAVPPDRECQIQNLTQIIGGVVDFTTIVSQTSQISGGTGDSTAQLALETANAALAAAQSAQASIPQRRFNGPVSIPTGDSQMPISWSPDMPDENYEVRVTFFGPNSAPATTPFAIVVTDSRTPSSCTLRLNNVPASFFVLWVVEQLPSS